MVQRTVPLLLVFSALIFSSCGYAVRLEGVDPLLNRERFEAFDDLLPLVDPENITKWRDSPTPQTEKQKKAQEEQALVLFHKNYPDDKGKLLRNAVQERLIAASKHRCGAYIRSIKGGQAFSGFGLGAFTTTVAGVSSILTGVAASALAAVGAISSGVHAEMNAQLFAEKAVEIIAGGIDKRREKLYNAIKEKQSKSVTEYNLTAALGDAVEHHSACTLSAGLAEVGESVTLGRDPGLKRLSEILGVKESDFTGPVRDAMLEEALKKLKEHKDKGRIDDTTFQNLQKNAIEKRFQ